MQKSHDKEPKGLRVSGVGQGLEHNAILWQHVMIDCGLSFSRGSLREHLSERKQRCFVVCFSPLHPKTSDEDEEILSNRAVWSRYSVDITLSRCTLRVRLLVSHNKSNCLNPHIFVLCHLFLYTVHFTISNSNWDSENPMNTKLAEMWKICWLMKKDRLTDKNREERTGEGKQRRW